MKEKKRVVCLLTIIAIILSLCSVTGCSNTGKKGNKIQVGIVLPTKDEPRWLQDQAQIEKILGNAGFSYQVLFSQGLPENEKSNVETLISKGIEVLIICAHDAAAAAATVQQAKSAGITVISYDRLITGTDAVDYYVTFDSIAVGEAQGQYLIDTAPSGKNIPLYLYAGAATDNNAFLFFEGAWKVLQPKIADGTFVIANSNEATALKNNAKLDRDQISSIIGQITTNWDFSVAKSKAEANLTAVGANMKNDVLILAPNDSTARSIADVFKTDKDITSYKITGQDSEQASVQYILNGAQSMTVFKDTRVLAKDSVDMAISILNKKTPSTDTTYNNGNKDVPSKQTKIEVITKDNVVEKLIDTGYYKSADFKM